MSTRCYIGLRDESGKITAIYCHSDGYPTYVGKILRDYYDTPEKVKKLLALGNISTLGKEPIDYPELWDFSKVFTEDYKEKMDKGCRTYKGRGETGQEAISFANKANFISYAEGSWAEWIYFCDIEDGAWYAQEIAGMLTLEEAIELEERRRGE